MDRRIPDGNRVPPENLHQAIAILWDWLPDYFGPDWDEVEQSLSRLLRELEGEDPKAAVGEILEIFSRSIAAEEALDAELRELEPLEEAGEEEGEPSRKGLRGAPVRGAGEAESGKLERYTVVPVYYATDREATGRREPEKFYSGDRGDHIRFGVAEVTIPDDHKVGKLEKPRWWRLEFREDPEKHVILVAVDELDEAHFIEEARGAAAQKARAEALVFVHGYNVSFEDAARQAAQFAYDMQFPGLPMMFSWPSRAKLLSYAADEATAGWAQDDFKTFLELCVNRLGLTHVHVVAHSMGNRLLAGTVGGAVDIDRSEDAAKLRQIVFAAPDVDAGTFRKLSKQFYERADGFTLYASSKDLALIGSHKLHGGYPRAGDSGDDLVVVDGVETVDATAVKTDFLGHAHFRDNGTALSDIYQLLMEGAEPEERGLKQRSIEAGPYWEMEAGG